MFVWNEAQCLWCHLQGEDTFNVWVSIWSAWVQQIGNIQGLCESDWQQHLCKEMLNKLCDIQWLMTSWLTTWIWCHLWLFWVLEHMTDGLRHDKCVMADTLGGWWNIVFLLHGKPFLSGFSFTDGGKLATFNDLVNLIDHDVFVKKCWTKFCDTQWLMTSWLMTWSLRPVKDFSSFGDRAHEWLSVTGHACDGTCAGMWEKHAFFFFLDSIFVPLHFHRLISISSLSLTVVLQLTKTVLLIWFDTKS